MDNSENTDIKFNINEIKLIVGLGNHGKEYDQTRHNAGFMFLDYILNGKKFNLENKFKSLLLESLLNDNAVIFSKPQTFMNSVGESVVLISSYFKIKPQEILIIHDDLDIQLGKYKFAFAKGPKIHNGILSVENRLSTKNFWRLRIGIDNRNLVERESYPGSNYVLSKFKNDEITLLLNTFEVIEQTL